MKWSGGVCLRGSFESDFYHLFLQNFLSINNISLKIQNNLFIRIRSSQEAILLENQLTHTRAQEKSY